MVWQRLEFLEIHPVIDNSNVWQLGCTHKTLPSSLKILQCGAKPASISYSTQLMK